MVWEHNSATGSQKYCNILVIWHNSATSNTFAKVIKVTEMPSLLDTVWAFLYGWEYSLGSHGFSPDWRVSCNLSKNFIWLLYLIDCTFTLSTTNIFHCFHGNPVVWGYRIHWLHFCWGARLSPNECPIYDIKHSDGDTPALEIWGIWNTSSLPLFPGLHWDRIGYTW